MGEELKCITCEMVQDLLPLYVDGVCSEDSVQIVEKHLKSCEKCRAYFEKMKTDVLERICEVDDKAVLVKYKRDIKTQVIGIGILSAFIIILIASIVMGMVGSVFTTGSSIEQEYYTIDVAEYGNWDGHIEFEKEELYGDSGLYTFPETINQALDADYFYYCGMDNNSISKYLIYAAVTYTEEDFEKEKERISGIECEVSIDVDKEVVTNSIMYTEELFEYPSYVAIYASNLCYEYVLVNEEDNQMIYVFTKLVDGQGIIPLEYLPIETKGKDMYEINSWENKNIYWSKDEYDSFISYKEVWE